MDSNSEYCLRSSSASKTIRQDLENASHKIGEPTDDKDRLPINHESDIKIIMEPDQSLELPNFEQLDVKVPSDRVQYTSSFKI